MNGVTALIPAHNEAAGIADTIASLQGQTYYRAARSPLIVPRGGGGGSARPHHSQGEPSMYMLPFTGFPVAIYLLVGLGMLVAGALTKRSGR